MTVDQFAEFWRLQGHKVIETKSCYWYNPYSFSFISLPYHRLVNPQRSELVRVLLGGPAVVIRFPGVLNGIGKEGGLFICSDRNYDLSSLHQKARNQTRRGLEQCIIEQIDFAYLAEHGHALNVETFQRQGRNPQTLTEQKWRQYCKAASRFPDFEAWGAFVNGRLASFVVISLVEDYCYILLQSSATGYLKYYPNNALIFTVTKLKLSRTEVNYVSYGFKSLEDTAGLNHFKLRMGFKIKPFKECVVFNPLLKPFLILGGRKIIKWISHKFPESDLWRKASRALDIAEGKLDV
jgi:hypothetical protein